MNVLPAAKVSWLLANIATPEDDQGDRITDSRSSGKTTRHSKPEPKKNDAEALHKRVIAAKVDRIDSYGRNPNIGSA